MEREYNIEEEELEQDDYWFLAPNGTERPTRGKVKKSSCFSIYPTPLTSFMLKQHMELKRSGKRQFILNNLLRLACQLELLFYVPEEELTDDFINKNIKRVYFEKQHEFRLIPTMTDLNWLSNDTIRQIKRLIDSDIAANPYDKFEIHNRVSHWQTYLKTKKQEQEANRSTTRSNGGGVISSDYQGGRR
jgi:hypothetical protein